MSSWRDCKTAKVKNGQVKIGDRARVMGLDDNGNPALLEGTVSQIKRLNYRRRGALVHIEIVDDEGIYLWGALAGEFEKV